MNLKIGITGGIGSGKTYVCSKFEKFGIPVYNADTRAKWLMNNDADLKKAIIKHFGENIYNNNILDRAKLASIVFNNQEKLQLLNSLVHPAVEKDVAKWQEENSMAPYTIKEAALLYETGSYKKLDKTILVHAPEDVRLLRVVERDKTNIKEVKSRMKNQMPELDKMELADFIINNDGREVEPIIEKLNMLFSM